MSGRRSRSRQSGSSRITDDQINDLVSKLQQLLPELRNSRTDKGRSQDFDRAGAHLRSNMVRVRDCACDKLSFGELCCGSHKLQMEACYMRNRAPYEVSAGKVLQETCNYIRSLHREVDDLSERLSELLETTDTAQAAIIRSLLMQ